MLLRSKQPSIELTRIRPVMIMNFCVTCGSTYPRGSINILLSVFLTCQNSFKPRSFVTLISRGQTFSRASHLYRFVYLFLPRFLVLCHGIYHLSVVFSRFTHLPKGLCVYQENTCDSLDIPWLLLQSVV